MRWKESGRGLIYKNDMITVWNQRLQEGECGIERGKEMQEAVKKSKAFKDWKVGYAQSTQEQYREQERDTKRRISIAVRQTTK